ncbi:hypothetical protein DPMN_172206 [Dreissena polymorpha]|uniref:Uncharacterized protein n=1 Tax=Dreissena polymorpha TaxID=45954 RepID=A0A9D4E159_DREPO|nr:hypothetical protein DPMN_172206 [Dreissena polymorpha]
MKTALSPGFHVFGYPNTISYAADRSLEKKDIIKFYEDCTENVTSKMRAKFDKIHHLIKCSAQLYLDSTTHLPSLVFKGKTASPPGGHVFRGNTTIFLLGRAIINTLTKFQEDYT